MNIYVSHYPKIETLPNPSGVALKDGAPKVIKFKEINVINGGGGPDPTGLVTWYEMFAVLFPYPCEDTARKPTKLYHQSPGPQLET